MMLLYEAYRQGAVLFLQQDDKFYSVSMPNPHKASIHIPFMTEAAARELAQQKLDTLNIVYVEYHIPWGTFVGWRKSSDS
jgi:hypothetical protein